eukprot:12429496-Karenia_brevis.AAC.1
MFSERSSPAKRHKCSTTPHVLVADDRSGVVAEQSTKERQECMKRLFLQRKEEEKQSEKQHVIESRKLAAFQTEVTRLDLKHGCCPIWYLQGQVGPQQLFILSDDSSFVSDGSDVVKRTLRISRLNLCSPDVVSIDMHPSRLHLLCSCSAHLDDDDDATTSCVVEGWDQEEQVIRLRMGLQGSVTIMPSSPALLSLLPDKVQNNERIALDEPMVNEAWFHMFWQSSTAAVQELYFTHPDWDTFFKADVVLLHGDSGG